MRITASRPSNRDEGSVLVEFALVFSIFAIMLFGMIQFGVVFNGWDPPARRTRGVFRRNGGATAECIGGLLPLHGQ